jgi:epoxyqueuosine reductase QueG
MVEGRTHKPVIHPEQCHSCNVCIRGCPAELIPEYRQEEKSLRGTLYRGKGSTASSRSKVPLPPCQEACPIRQDTKGYVTLIARGKFKEALELIREVNPLPAVTSSGSLQNMSERTSGRPGDRRKRETGESWLLALALPGLQQPMICVFSGMR